MPVSKQGRCCTECLADWTDENQEQIEVDEQDGPATLQCILDESVLVSPDDVSFSDESYLDDSYLDDSFQ